MKINIVSGYFDPVHDGHIELFENASRGCDKLIVILNNDLQTSQKKGKPFMEEKVRKKIVESIKYVDEVFLSIDKEQPVCNSIAKICDDHPNDEITFINGGDRTLDEIPEYILNGKKANLKFIDGAGEKINSSRKYYSKEE
ncbi:MAG: adenylyltransferase/cytidyltransferase family protein [Candidatus Diapherotrites archaeon]|jgi:cytidyltransferase-like protein|uniref:Adenylyltransferase/cytidyltransferase family protein n=1 Tax=Candidatus Iainarchaeum sp. TaxID=3101447 RepID=A0A8T5GEW6_9ARCH|nr:adenylyltransferase/cytidyltransferase family protein [Candidatus Diapherotrites archaeon]